MKTMRRIVYVATGRPLPVGAAAYTSTLPQALLVGFGILAPHIANKHKSKTDRPTICWTNSKVSSLKSSVLKGICGNEKCSKDTLDHM